MKKILLRFGAYENITPSGMDGTMLQFRFSKVDSSLFGLPAEPEATTWHSLKVSVANGTDWADDKSALAKILFKLGAPSIIDAMSDEGDLPKEIPFFVHHQDRPCDPDTLSDSEEIIIEVELPSRRTRNIKLICAETNP